MAVAAADARADVLERSQGDPVWFVREVLGQHPWSKQRQILRSVRDHRKTAVRSCHGPGKTMIAAATTLWFLNSFPNSRVITTATTGRQVRDLLWREVNNQYAGARYPLGGKCLQTRLELPDGRFAVGFSSKPENTESFMGHHEEHVLFVFDEASGVLQAIYDAAEGSMTTPNSRWLLIGNPTRTAGEFYDAFHAKRAEYSRVHISAFDTPNFTGEKVPGAVARRLVSQEWVEGRRKAWKGSPLWDVKVLGQFAKGADDTVMALADVEAAGERVLVPEPAGLRVVAADVARFGSDETVIAVRHDRRVRIARSYYGHPTTETAGAMQEVARDLDIQVHGQEPVRFVVDDDGVGGGVTDILRERGLEVVAFNAGGRAHDPELYPNRRSEHWFHFAERLGDVDLDPDAQLAADLTAPVYRLDSAGRRVVEPKDKIKKRLGRSPDRADGVLLTYVDEQHDAELGPEVLGG